MITSFKSSEAEIIFNGGISKKLPRDIQSVAFRKLGYVDAAERLEDLRVPPGNRLEALHGDRLGQHSVRINDQWRVCFVWDNRNTRCRNCRLSLKAGNSMNHSATIADTLNDVLPNTPPGEMLREDFLEPLGITPYKLAKGTGLSPIHVSEILSGKRSITPMTSILLGRFFDMSPRFWLNLQNRHDIIEVQRTNSLRIEKVLPYRQQSAA